MLKIKKVNHGKRFEEDFIKSLPGSVFRLRLKDAGGWSNAENTRFTVSNPCDFIIQSPEGKLHMVELKTHKGKSIPYSAMKQLDELVDYGDKYAIKCVFVLNFRDLNETYMIEAITLKGLQIMYDRKSFALDNVRAVGKLISQRLKRVRYRYLLDDTFDN